MRVEGVMVGAKGQEEPLADKGKKSSKKNKRRQKKSTAATSSTTTTPPPPPVPVVQRLYDTCREIFAGCGPGVVPATDDVLRLRSLLDTMKPADVGLNPDMSFFRSVSSNGPPPITYLHVYSCQSFSIGIFCLPRKAVIPLHNHPGMTVFSKLLFGSVHIKSYDWVDAPQQSDGRIKSSNGACLAKLIRNNAFKAPCETSILYPAAGGNMHCLTAVTSCAVLDVLGPPYDDKNERDCTYYNEFPYPSLLCGDAAAAVAVGPSEGEEYAWLEAREREPEYLRVVGAKYMGPEIDRH